jgi:ATP/maltotriose-dependent transcriptional regulator MalT
LGRVWERGRAEAATDVDVGTASNAALAARVGVRTALAFPALGHSGPLAVLAFHHTERHEPTERMLTTLESMGGELGRFLEQRRGQLGTQRLSDRELEVLQLAAEGNSGPQIAERLFLSPTTIKTHFEHIYEKLGVGDRAAAVAYALRTGIIR